MSPQPSPPGSPSPDRPDDDRSGGEGGSTQGSPSPDRPDDDRSGGEGGSTPGSPSPDRSTLSEADSKRRLAEYGVPVLPDRRIGSADDAVGAAAALGFPVVVKLGGDAIAHKTERGLVRLNLGDEVAVRDAAEELLRSARPEDGEVHLLVAPMVRGARELIAGLHTDAQFGRCVMVGFGGILAEAIADVAFRLVPLERIDADEMIEELGTQALLGPFRGEPPVDRDALAATLLGLSALAVADPEVVSVDVNPLIVVDGRPVAVDALIEIAGGAA